MTASHPVEKSHQDFYPGSSVAGRLRNAPPTVHIENVDFPAREARVRLHQNPTLLPLSGLRALFNISIDERDDQGFIKALVDAGIGEENDARTKGNSSGASSL